ncbi:MAG: hypothetical protein MPJ04_06820 [Nitrosopumilus sp.]|nr:hypothetical protein [Nitrosopumilus sp.]MDA7945460.1 hypothetical protein [Nitrosopumilus sp.]MDA7955244.1 hypothetical protein [Nitrosopumilus sp.]MDA7974019.1 hypothetical protein [Nitrosopumilus sp.]MDA7997876.1 hypothetical protein [Nitrosopumilus sp.]
MLRRGCKPQIGTTVETGQTFPETGYYSYAGHKGDHSEGCYVSPYAKGGMLFRKGRRAPDLISCSHAVRWKLDAIY